MQQGEWVTKEASNNSTATAVTVMIHGRLRYDQSDSNIHPDRKWETSN